MESNAKDILEGLTQRQKDQVYRWIDEFRLSSHELATWRANRDKFIVSDRYKVKVETPIDEICRDIYELRKFGVRVADFFRKSGEPAMLKICGRVFTQDEAMRWFVVEAHLKKPFRFNNGEPQKILYDLAQETRVTRKRTGSTSLNESALKSKIPNSKPLPNVKNETSCDQEHSSISAQEFPGPSGVTPLVKTVHKQSPRRELLPPAVIESSAQKSVPERPTSSNESQTRVSTLQPPQPKQHQQIQRTNVPGPSALQKYSLGTAVDPAQKDPVPTPATTSHAPRATQTIVQNTSPTAAVAQKVVSTFKKPAPVAQPNQLARLDTERTNRVVVTQHVTRTEPASTSHATRPRVTKAVYAVRNGSAQTGKVIVAGHAERSGVTQPSHVLLCGAGPARLVPLTTTMNISQSVSESSKTQYTSVRTISSNESVSGHVSYGAQAVVTAPQIFYVPKPHSTVSLNKTVNRSVEEVGVTDASDLDVRHKSQSLNSSSSGLRSPPVKVKGPNFSTSTPMQKRILQDVSPRDHDYHHRHDNSSLKTLELEVELYLSEFQITNDEFVEWLSRNSSENGEVSLATFTQADAFINLITNILYFIIQEQDSLRRSLAEATLAKRYDISRESLQKWCNNLHLFRKDKTRLKYEMFGKIIQTHDNNQDNYIPKYEKIIRYQAPVKPSIQNPNIGKVTSPKCLDLLQSLLSYYSLGNDFLDGISTRNFKNCKTENDNSADSLSWLLYEFETAISRQNEIVLFNRLFSTKETLFCFGITDKSLPSEINMFGVPLEQAIKVLLSKRKPKTKFIDLNQFGLDDGNILGKLEFDCKSGDQYIPAAVVTATKNTRDKLEKLAKSFELMCH